MTWIKLDDAFVEHPKVVGLSDGAFRLLVRCCLTGAREQRVATPFISDEFLRKVAGRRIGRTVSAVRQLEAAGWFRRAPGGWWLDSNELWRLGPVGNRPKVPIALRVAVYERDGYQCVVCGTEDDLTLDHVWPQSRGGRDTIENLQTMCRPHNSSKGARV